jgi:hypothetical protein
MTTTQQHKYFGNITSQGKGIDSGIVTPIKNQIKTQNNTLDKIKSVIVST